MPDSGVLIIGDNIIGYAERYVYCSWDVPADILSQRTCGQLTPYLNVYSARYVFHEHIKHIYSERNVSIKYTPIPVTDRYAYADYVLNSVTTRYCYFYPDTGFRYCFYESLLKQTPLLLKVPKYTDWEYIPQIIHPEFKVWSHYDLDEDNISLHITSDNDVNIFLNSGINKSSFKIVKNSDKIYTITCYINHTFDNGEVIDCHLSMFDKKGNYLKDGLW